MASSLNGTGVTFSNGSTQSVAWPGNTGTVTSVATGNGLTGGTITGSGTISLDVYNGTASNNTSYPVGTTVMTNGIVGAGVNVSAAVWSPTTTGSYFGGTSMGTGSGALAGTWRKRGDISYGCVNASIFTRTA